MAAIFQIRRGGSSDTSSLASGELYLNTNEGALQVGTPTAGAPIKLLSLNTASFGDIILTGSAYISGDVVLGGTITIGDTTSDSVVFNADLSSSIIPDSGSTYDLGSISKVYRNVYATSISGAIAATNGVISGSSQVVASLPQGLVSGSSQVIGILDSLNSLTGSYATTGSNTFRGNQRITGSLSISNGQFNVITGSGALTSSLTFTHNITAPNDGNAILELRHNNELYNDDIAIKLKADFAGAYLDYEEDTVPYSILSVQSFANKNLYIHQDTRLLFSNLRIDENLTVTGSIIGLSGFTGSFSGSIPVQDGRLTNLESKSASVDISVAELNSYTSSLKTAITASGANVTINGNLTVKGTTTQIDSTTLNIGDNIIELNYGGSQTLSGIYTKDATGVLSSGSLLWNATTDRWIAGISGSESTILLAGGDNVFTSSLQLSEINNTTASLNQTTASLNSFSASVTTSLESIYQTTSSLNLFSASVTASLVSVYQTTASLNTYTQSVNSDLVSIHQSSASINLFSASVTASLESIYQTTASLNSFSASVTASLESIYQTTASLNSFTSSQLTQNTALSTVSGSLIISASQSYLSASLMTASVKKLREDVDYLYGIGGISGGNPLAPIQEWSASARISIANLELFTSSFSESVSASIASLESSSGYINYVTNSIQQLTGIEVADFDSNVAVTFVNGTLKFIFGTPAIPTSIATSLSGFAADRFNNVNDAYIVNGTWSNQGYTLVSASLYEGSTLLTEVGSGTSLSFSTTTSGSHTYRLEYTASSPLDGTLYKTSTTATGTVSKSSPASPTLTPTPTVQLGASSNQIEQGATGSISFTSSSANPSNGWNLINTTTNVSTPYFVTGSATGSTSISITATANYESPTGDNIPDLTTTSTATTTYTKIRSLRYGASSATSFTAGELENIGAWDTTLGGTIGTIAKGTTTASGQSVTISWTGDKYHYIVFNSSLSNLTNITTSGFGVFGTFESVATVGQYKVYKTSTLQAGGAGSSITYTLT
jgi:hypothetical protein